MFVRMLGNLSAQMDKAEAYATAKKFDVNNFVGMRLAPDMLPFSKQVQIACDTAKLSVARLTGVEAPKNEDTEKTFPELKERIAKTVAFLESVPVDRFAGAEDRDVTWPRGGQMVTLPASKYFLGHAVPNFYFHYTTAYAIMRHGGVDLGKADVLRGLV
jgi:hypothetical protein